MPSLSSEAKQQIKSHLDGITSDSGKTGIPGVVFVAVDKEGSSLVEVASGQKGLTDSSKMDMDSVFCIFSCTKMITGIACMQLVEQGKLKLDSPEQVYEICPEIKAKKVLTPTGELEDRKKDITLRMLLTHTAGFGYSFFNPFLRDYGRPTGWDEFSGDEKDYLLQPLVFQPGDMWQYGINIDWAGIIVERVTGLKLNEYFQQNIFEPLGLKNINMFPTQHMRENMVTMQQKYADGSFADHDHLSRRSIWHSDEPGAKDKIFNSGGAGCFAKPKEYTQIIATLLNNGTSPTTKKQILKPETVEEMFKNQIPQFPDFGRGGVPAAKPLQTNPIPDIYPQEGNPPQGWGITWMITIEPGMTGRGANTAFWAGITNLFWWADREKGVGGMIAAQTLPFADPHILGGWVTCEKAVYDGLQA